MTRAILTKLTPALPSFVPIIQEELEYGAALEIPECRGMDLTHFYYPLSLSLPRMCIVSGIS